MCIAYQKTTIVVVCWLVETAGVDPASDCFVVEFSTYLVYLHFCKLLKSNKQDFRQVRNCDDLTLSAKKLKSICTSPDPAEYEMRSFSARGCPLLRIRQQRKQSYYYLRLNLRWLFCVKPKTVCLSNPSTAVEACSPP